MRMAIAAAALSVLPLSASADPLIKMWLLGRVAGSGDPFSSSVAVMPGDSVEYQVWGAMASIGATNTQGTTTRTITSLTASTGVQAGDGLQSLSLDVFQNPTDPIQIDLHPAVLNTDPTGMDNDSWAVGIGASGTGKPRAGTVQPVNDLLGVRPIHAPGVRTAVTPEMIFSGLFDVPQASAGGASLVRLRWSTDSATTTGSFRINGSDIIFVTAATESSADPFVGIDPDPPTGSSLMTTSSAFADSATYQLQLVLAPEPSSCALIGLACAGLMARRRRI